MLLCRRALRLRPFQTTLWIEHGATAYMIHSQCSRLLHNQTDSLSIEMFERLEKEKERMLDIAHDCFVAADKAWLAEVGKGEEGAVDQDERWLHHYMLGKVAEKRAKPVEEYLANYQRAAVLLEEASAAYPRRITYNTPPLLSVEALEIYYRIHSNILKTLLNHEGRPMDPKLAAVLNKHLEEAAEGLFTNEGRRSSVDDKETAKEKEAVKRKASSKHEEENAAKKIMVKQGIFLFSCALLLSLSDWYLIYVSISVSENSPVLEVKAEQGIYHLLFFFCALILSLSDW